jgi:phosphatidylinositol 4-kinase
MTRDIRARALEKIAALSAASSATSTDKSDLDRLYKACHAGARGGEHGRSGHDAKPNGSLGIVPMVSKPLASRLTRWEAKARS